MTEDEIAVVRRAYAKQILATSELRDDALEAAFAAVPRERHLGPGPWPILRPRGYVDTPDADPVHLYADHLVGIDVARRLNNGQPSFLALLMHYAGPRPGEHAVHVGAGVGYFTAVLAELVGPGGRVTGIEFDPGLAARARASLAPRPNAEMIAGDGAAVEVAPADVVLVNAGVTRPAPRWLDGLRDGGRLVLPLTTDVGWSAASNLVLHGAVFLVTRRGNDYEARRLSAVGIFPSASMRDPEGERALAAAFGRDDGRFVTRLHRRGPRRGEDCWLDGGDWCLTGG